MAKVQCKQRPTQSTPQSLRSHGEKSSHKSGANRGNSPSLRVNFYQSLHSSAKHEKYLQTLSNTSVFDGFNKEQIHEMLVTMPR
jgi:hypothetical protein